MVANPPPEFSDADPSDGVVAGPCAMGDVAPGDRLTFMHVLIVQHAGDRVATATGVGDRLRRADNTPGAGRWVVNTERATGSDDFVLGKPAIAMAMAVAQHDDGGVEIERWSQAVTIVGS